MMNNLYELISSGNYLKARELTNGMDLLTLENHLNEIAFKYEDISVYSFVCYLLSENESAILHKVASMLMIHPLCFISGAYSIALYHLKMAMKLDSQDVSLKELLLFFYSLPDRLLTKENALRVAKEILMVEPKNGAALEFVEKYKK